MQTTQGINRHLRYELGINLSNRIVVNESDGTTFQKLIKEFFDRDNISRICPDMKQLRWNPDNAGERVPAR